MDNIVRVGVVGTSWYTDLMHLPMLNSHPQARIVALCGRNQARAHELADRHGVMLVFDDYHEMMSQDLVDAVIVSVPDDLHHPITMNALDAGLHVLCEKPLAFNQAQAREMLVKAETAGVKHMAYFTYRWAPWVRLMQKLVHEGFIGQFFDAHFEYLGGYARAGRYQWKWDQAHGLGALGDLGSHVIDMAHLFVGNIARVRAHLSTGVSKPHPDGLPYIPSNDTANLQVQFANGSTGTIYTSAVTEVGNRSQVQRVRLNGSDGTLEMIADWLGYTVRGIRRGEMEYRSFPVPREFLAGSPPVSAAGSPISVWEEFTQIFSHQSVGTRLFIDSILKDCPIIPGFAEGVKVMGVIDAALRSDEGGCWVEVEK
jgi:predicted dehydrogenase